MKEIIKELDKKRLIIDKEKVSLLDSETKKYLEVNNIINKKTSSTSGTFKVVEKCIKIDAPHRFKESYLKKLSIGNNNFEFKFERIIERSLVNTIFYIDFRKFSIFNKISMKYGSILEAQKKYRKLFGGTEVDLSYIPVFSRNKVSKVIYSLTPMDQIKSKLRKKMILQGLESLRYRRINDIIISQSDQYQI